MNALQRLVQRVDRLQRGHVPLSFVYAVVKKYDDDDAGNLSALVTYYGFLSLFPLLLVLVTVLGIVAGGHPSLSHRIEHSALAEFPVIGTNLAKNIHAMHRDSVAGLVIGLLGLVWGSQGATQIGQRAMADVWNIPTVDRPGAVARIRRSLLMLVVLAVFLVATTAAAGFVSFARAAPLGATVGSVVATLVLNVLFYLLAFRILTPSSVSHRSLVAGALTGGLSWSVLQYAGTLLIDHELRGTNNVYGFFGIVLGLLAWIYLGAEATLYSAELNAVLARHLWPRAIRPPLTEADLDMDAALARQTRRRPGQHVEVELDEATRGGASAG